MHLDDIKAIDNIAYKSVIRKTVNGNIEELKIKSYDSHGINPTVNYITLKIIDESELDFIECNLIFEDV